MLANLIALPNLKDSDRRGFVRQLDLASKDASDILRTDDTDDGMEDVKRMFRNL